MALGVLAGVEVGGAACLQPTYPDPPVPVLQPRYVATSTNTLAPNTVYDAKNDTIRIYADTLYFDLTNKTYVQAARVGRFVGFAAESISLERVAGNSYSVANNEVSLPVTITGPGGGPIIGSYELRLALGQVGTFSRRLWLFVAR